MRTAKIALIACLLGGCNEKTDSLVIVDVTADAPLTGISTLAVSATAGRTVTFSINPPAGSSEIDINPSTQTFGIDLPKGIAGNLSVHVDALGGDGSVMASGDGSANINAGGRANLELMLVSGTAMDMGAGGDLGGADMTPMPGGPVLTIDRTKQAFGNVTVGQSSATVNVVVTNTGEAPTSALTFTPSGANLDQFSLTSDCSAALMPNQSCNVTTSFSPTATGDKTSHFDVTATMGGTVGADVTGTGTPPGTVSIAPSMQSCGSALLNTPSTTMATFTVTNIGTSATGMASASTSDPQFVASGCAKVLQPNDTCTVTVTFTPTARGMQTASVSVMATPGGLANASATGTGLKPATFSVNPSSYTFPTAAARNSTGATKTFTVTNVGDVTGPTLTQSTITGTNAGSFMRGTDTCNTHALAANGTCTVDVQFDPVTSGSLAATLNINAAAVVATSTLSATGTPIWVQEAAGMNGQLYGVHGSDASNVFAMGDAIDGSGNITGGLALARNADGTWTSQQFLSSTNGDQVCTSDVANAWAADSERLHYLSSNGTWLVDVKTGSPTDTSGGSIVGVWTFNANSVWSSVSTSSMSTIYHYTAANGWVTETSPAGAYRFWGTSDTDLYAYGNYLAGGDQFAVIVHRDATNTWTRQYLGPGAFVGANLHAGITAVAGVGAPATTLYASEVSNGPLKGVGGVWTTITGFPTGATSCSGVWAASTTAVWFVCTAGVYQYDGTNWSTPFAPAGMALRWAWGSSANDVYVVGDDNNNHVAIYHLY